MLREIKEKNKKFSTSLKLYLRYEIEEPLEKTQKEDMIAT